MTVMTRSGGLGNDRTSVMSALFSDRSALIAEWYAGIA
jgi:hypothetical protein